MQNSLSLATDGYLDYYSGLLCVRRAQAAGFRDILCGRKIRDSVLVLVYCCDGGQIQIDALAVAVGLGQKIDSNFESYRYFSFSSERTLFPTVH